MSDKIKIIIVDDSSFMRNVLARLVEKDGRFDVVGKAKDGAEGVEMVKSLQPDVVTMDIEMPVMTGIEALKIIMKERPTPVVMVSALTKEGALATLEAMDHGAVDFIPKNMGDGAASVLTNSKFLMDKIYGASQARLVHLSAKPAVTKAPERKPISHSVDRLTARSTDTQKVSQQRVAEKAIIAEPTRSLRRPIGRIGLPSAKVMVIGSSTGGPRALQDVIPKLPATIKVPVVVAQHMPHHFTGQMADRLNSISKLHVVEGKDGDILQAGTVYISPGGIHTRVKSQGSSLVLSIKEDTGKECVYRPSVDLLANSVAEQVGGSVLALMMTGMGSDGAKGFGNLKDKGGYILAQDELSSVVYGMPKAVASIADEVLPLDSMVAAIIRLVG
ncbi:MAG: two-component system chemotaxis response regulator CheB [Alphaproteobacteria bacterium]